MISDHQDEELQSAYHHETVSACKHHALKKKGKLLLFIFERY